MKLAWQSANCRPCRRELQRTLQSRKHLADLGLAVSKINHDMRNMLAPAQLLSDRLTDLEDPAVRKIAPRLLRALDRAVTFSESVLAYGKGREQEPNFSALMSAHCAMMFIELLQSG